MRPLHQKRRIGSVDFGRNLRNRTLAFSVLLLLFTTSFAFGKRQKLKSEFDKDEWLAQRQTLYLGTWAQPFTSSPKFKFTLTSAAPILTNATAPSLKFDNGAIISKNPKASAPNAILADQTWTGGAGGTNTAWFTVGNWAGGAFPGATPAPANTTNADVATIGSTGTNPDIGINLNFTGSTLGLGAINFNGASRGIGNSSNAAGAQNGTLRLNGATVNSVANVILRNFGSGTLTLYASAPGSGVVVGPMSLALGNLSDNLMNIDSTGGILINAVVKDGVSGAHLTLGGAGTGALTLTGANTYTGGTTVGTGILEIGVATVSGTTITSSAVGTGTLTLGNGATLRSDNTTARTLKNNLSLSGNIVLGATSTQTGALTFNSTGLTTASTVALTANTQLTTNVAATINNVISGSGFDLTKAGSASLSLGAANTFSGSFTASTGTTNLDVNNALGGVSAVSVSSGATVITSVAGLTDAINNSAAVTVNGTLDVSGGTETVASLAGTNSSASLVIGKSGAASGGFTVGNSNNTSFAGVVKDGAAGAGTTAFTKQGSGTLTLTGANTYSGTTSVNAGTLLISNTTGSGTGTSTVAVSNSGTILGGTGTISGTVTVNANAAILGGSGTTGATQKLTLSGNLTLNSNSIIELALGPSLAHSTLARTGGTWSFQTNQQFTFINLGATTGTYDNIITGLASNPGTGSWTITNSGWTGTFTYDGANIDLNLTAVPEPSTWIAGALALGVVGWNVRRRCGQKLKI